MKSPRFLVSLVIPAFLSLACSKDQEAETPEAHSNECKSPLAEDEVTLDPDEVWELVETHNELIQNCYNQALDMNPGLSGRITVNLVVDSAGVPTQVCSGGSTLPNQRVVACVLNTISRFRFNERDEAQAGIYPISFSPN